MGRALQDAGAGRARQAAVPEATWRAAHRAGARRGRCRASPSCSAAPRPTSRRCGHGRRCRRRPMSCARSAAGSACRRARSCSARRATEAALKDLSDKRPPRRLRDPAFRHARRATGQVQGAAEPGLILTPPAKGTSDAEGAGARRRLPHGVRDRHPQARRRLGDPVGLQYGRAPAAKPRRRCRAWRAPSSMRARARCWSRIGRWARTPPSSSPRARSPS